MTDDNDKVIFQLTVRKKGVTITMDLVRMYFFLKYAFITKKLVDLNNFGNSSRQTHSYINTR